MMFFVKKKSIYQIIEIRISGLSSVNSEPLHPITVRKAIFRKLSNLQSIRLRLLSIFRSTGKESKEDEKPIQNEITQ